MNCKRVQRWLPLMAGSEIPQRKISALKAHLQRCPKCRSEYEAYLFSLEKTKELLEADRKNWEEGEWQEVLRKAVEEKAPEVSPLVPWPFKKAWAYAFMAVIAVLLALFVIKPSFIHEDFIPGSGMVAENQPQLFEGLEARPKQDIISMTLVSKETGLKIVWFFNKNFELEVPE